MPTPDLELVRTVLTKNDRDIACRDAVESAWSTVKEHPDLPWWRRKSTRAALMWEHSVDNAISRLGDDPGIQVVRHHDTSSFVVDDKVLLRFKKASIQLYTSNYPTFLATLFHSHDADLFGYEGLHRVEVAHVFNQFETGLDWIGVVAREGRDILWHYEIGRDGAQIERLPIPEPLAPAGDRVLRPHVQGTNEKFDDKGNE
ncbi:hypothetical protein [Methylosinus sp. Ce-a6]|uniref:hypothetical protein n=1 Tax=Methylosinus sp. Ce-a6 TaxID=2172005 RepID=UPI001357F704|nr:hypothetical protein [Methylosinus sp. Ce-a6]